MSLATRCIHCGTIFKIVEDQLKVSEGWVRCGRCHEVFNALPTLFDMDSEAPPPRRAPDAALLREPVTEAFTPPAPVRSPPAPDPQIEDELPPEPARPVRGTTDFELDTSVPAQEMSWTRRHDAPPASTPLAAPSRPTPSPLAPPPIPEAELPSTDEADALDSRYLMPSDRERPAPPPRTPGPPLPRPPLPAPRGGGPPRPAPSPPWPGVRRRGVPHRCLAGRRSRCARLGAAGTRAARRDAPLGTLCSTLCRARGLSRRSTGSSPPACDACQEDEQKARCRPHAGIHPPRTTTGFLAPAFRARRAHGPVAGPAAVAGCASGAPVPRHFGRPAPQLARRPDPMVRAGALHAAAPLAHRRPAGGQI